MCICITLGSTVLFRFGFQFICGWCWTFNWLVEVMAAENFLIIYKASSLDDIKMIAVNVLKGSCICFHACRHLWRFSCEDLFEIIHLVMHCFVLSFFADIFRSYFPYNNKPHHNTSLHYRFRPYKRIALIFLVILKQFSLWLKINEKINPTLLRSYKICLE